MYRDLKTYIANNMLTSALKPNTRLFRNHIKVIEEIMLVTSWANKPTNIIRDITTSQAIFLILNNIISYPKCICGDNNKFVGYDKNAFTTFCTKSCATTNNMNQIKITRRENIESKKEIYNILSLDATKEIINNNYNRGLRLRLEEFLTRHDIYHSVLYYTKNIECEHLSQRLHMIQNDITSTPKCKNCNNIVGFNHTAYEFREFCSVSCQSIYNSPINSINYFNKTGFLYPPHNPKVKAKAIETCLKKYGETNPNKTKEVRDKIENTCLLKYGVRNFAQSNFASNGYRWYDYTLPSGNKIKYQGYENRYIPILIRKYKEHNVVFNKVEIPKIKYILDGVEHVYFPDFFVPKANLIIEIKSTYTYNKDLIKNNAKFEATVDAGYKLKVKVYK